MNMMEVAGQRYLDFAPFEQRQHPRSPSWGIEFVRLIALRQRMGGDPADQRTWIPAALSQESFQNIF
jgi:hypothetical protein